MNLSYRNMIVGALAAGVIASVVSAMAQEPKPVPAAIVLDGITSLLGDNRACFKVLFTGGLREADFMMAEGQTRYGIRLLAVNTSSNTVTISNQGLTRVIPICKTPTLLAGATAGGDDSASANQGGNHVGTASAGKAPAPGNLTRPGSDGSLTQTGYAQGPGRASGNDLPNNPTGDANGSRNASGGSDGNGTADVNSGTIGSTGTGDNPVQEYHWWTKEAEKVEAAREATAQQVMDGSLQPYPLTPLTPPGTPASLVGTNSVFFYFDPLAAND